MNEKKEEQKEFFRDANGTLCRNPRASPYSRISYKDPDEAIKVKSLDEWVLACTERTMTNYHSGPCGNKPKYDPDANGLFTKCGHHSEASKKRKKDKQDARFAKWMSEVDFNNAWREHNAKKLEIIKAIAEGHNDPRSLCQEWLNDTPKKEKPDDHA